MVDLGTILRELESTRMGLASAADRVPDDLWQQQPSPGKWSAADVVAHLTLVENRVNQGARRVIQHPPRPIPIWQRVHLPLFVVRYRLVRFRTPVPPDSSLVSGKAGMLAQHSDVRKQTLALLEETRDRDLTAYRWKHPLLGYLNFYGWYRMVAQHEYRHTKQLREIGRSLQST